MRKITLISLVILFMSQIALYAESRSKIGVILPLSGQFARIGQMVKSGILEPETVGSFEFEDESCNALTAVSAFKSLNAQNIKLFLGPCCGSPQMAVAPLLKSSNSFVLLMNSASRAVFQASDGKMFSVQFSIEDEASFLAESIYSEGFKKVLILFTESDFARAHESQFRKVYKGEIAGTETYSNGDISALRSSILKIKQLKPDAIFVPDISPLLLGFKKELKNAGLDDLPVYSIYAAQTPDVIEANLEALKNLTISYPDIGEENAFTYYSRLGSKIISAAASRCGPDPECVQTYLRANYDFDEYGVLSTKFVLKKVKDGKFAS